MYKNVMLIDDDSVDLMIHQRLLNKAGFAEKYISMVSAPDALEYLENGPGPFPELIFLDIRMPRMDGFEFMEHFQEKIYRKYPDCWIVVLSSTIHASDHRRAREYPFVKQIVIKPLDMDSVFELAGLRTA